jgi:hypothetical protein
MHLTTKENEMKDMNYLKTCQIGKAMAVNGWKEFEVKCYLADSGFKSNSFTTTRVLRAYNEQLIIG